MIRICFALGILLTSLFTTGQPLRSPSDFLGYEPGDKFTPHASIAAYFRMAASAGTGMMKLEEYGNTYEGRPLMLAMVTDPSNLSRLEDIRRNNLALAGMDGWAKADVNLPVVIWLSYNVHGNEASSSEVVMTVLYDLLSGKNKALREQLKRAVIIIDPCLNPDGRDRYVNWYNQQVVKAPNPEPEALEHEEPWPGVIGAIIIILISIGTGPGNRRRKQGRD